MDSGGRCDLTTGRFHITSVVSRPMYVQALTTNAAGRTGGRDDDAADGRSCGSREVVGHRIQRDGRWDVFARDLLTDRRLPGRPVERHAASPGRTSA